MAWSWNYEASFATCYMSKSCMTCMFAPSHAILSTHHSISKVASLVNIYYVIQRNYFKKPYYVFLLLSSDEKNLFYISLLRLSDIVKLFGTADNVCNISVTTSGWNNKLFSIGRLNRCLIITCYLG